MEREKGRTVWRSGWRRMMEQGTDEGGRRVTMEWMEGEGVVPGCAAPCSSAAPGTPWPLWPGPTGC